MAQQTPDPKLINSMAMRYRHDFGLLEEPQKESIRTTMKQLWEEVVGLGFYKDEQFGNSKQLAQQTAVEWMIDEIDIAYPDIEIKKKISITAQAKEMEKQQHGNTWDAAINAHESRGHVIARSICDFDEYYNENYNK
jgi:hypothetical protein